MAGKLNLDKHLPKQSIKVSYFDNDGKRIDNITQDQAKQVEKLRPGTKFYFQDGDGVQKELNITQVLDLKPRNLLPTVPSCPTAPQQCGPPKVKIFGGGGFGAVANAIISPNSNSVIGFDIVNPGRNYTEAPFIELVDECGKGNGSRVRANMKSVGITTTDADVGIGITFENNLQIKNITIESVGDGYIQTPDGSLGGDGRVWKEVDEGYAITDDGKYYVVPPGINPPPNSTYIPPTTPAVPSTAVYPVLLEIEEVAILDGGFGYQSTDTIQITPDKGAVLKPIIQGGQVIGVNVINPGLGFDDIPEIEVISDTGYNAEFSPIFKIVEPSQVVTLPPTAKIVKVVDCVGKF